MNPHMISNLIVVSYLGPDTIMPLASALAAIVGILMITWRYILAFFKKVFRRAAPVEDPVAMMNTISEDSEEQ